MTFIKNASEKEGRGGEEKGERKEEIYCRQFGARGMNACTL